MRAVLEELRKQLIENDRPLTPNTDWHEDFSILPPTGSIILLLMHGENGNWWPALGTVRENNVIDYYVVHATVKAWAPITVPQDDRFQNKSKKIWTFA